MSVVAEIKEIGPCRKQLSIQVPEAALEAELERVVDSFRRQAKAPGFRKGKMPATLVRQRFREDIEKEVLDRLIPRYWNQARAETDLDPLMAPEVQDVDFEPDGRLSFVATVEVRPAIELGDLESFDLPDPSTEAGEEEIEEALERLRRDAGTWFEVDRPAADGDLVEGHVMAQDHVHDDQTDDHSHDVAFEVGDERVWTELSAAARDLSAGDETSFERSTAEAEGESKHFDLKVAVVKERELPDLDDELAGRLGDVETVDMLREKVNESIVASKRGNRLRERERALLDQLRERHHFPLPEGVVAKEIEGLLGEYANGLASRGVDVEVADVDWQELGEQVRPQAIQRVEARLILDAIAEARGIEVSSERLEATLASLARAQKTSTVALRQSMDQSGQLERLGMQLRRHKTLAMLLGEEPDSPAPEESDNTSNEGKKG